MMISILLSLLFGRYVPSLPSIPFGVLLKKRHHGPGAVVFTLLSATLAPRLLREDPFPSPPYRLCLGRMSETGFLSLPSPVPTSLRCLCLGLGGTDPNARGVSPWFYNHFIQLRRLRGFYSLLAPLRKLTGSFATRSLIPSSFQLHVVQVRFGD